MESKENDWLLSNLVNPNTSVRDFKAAGFSALNTSLESEDTYKKKQGIQNNPLFQTDGKFDESKLHNFYVGLSNTYAHLADETYYEDLKKNTLYHVDNLWADPNLRRDFLEFTPHNLFREPNPLGQTTGIRRLGLTEAPKFSNRERAQTLKVLANPVAATKEDGSIDPAIAIWHDAPNDSFWTDFGTTRVLALWDEDGYHKDPFTGLMVKHSKGELKINDEGTYYYENLDGRDVYGRQVLSKWDTLTTDGSAMNSIDFFDSDDLEKNTIGSIMRSVVEIAPMFTPVGPYYVGLRVALSIAKTAANLGKVFTGSDNPTLSAIEGFIDSTDFSQSDYANSHPWSVENIINMAGDVFSQMEEQRWVFKYMPSLIRGSKLGFSEEARLELEAKWAAEYAKTYSDPAQLKRIKDAKSLAEFEASRIAYANEKMKLVDKQFLKTGELMSLAYMTGITTVDAYGEAKLQGASDFEAAALSLIYMAGEFGILKTDLGKWVLPELRVDANRMKLVAKVLTTIQSTPAPPASASKEAKSKWFSDISKKALNVLKGEYSAAELSAGSIFANSMGEGIEEVVEELWADMSKSVVNLGVWMTGQGLSLTAWDNMFDRYGLSFVGGTLGGALLQAKPDFLAAKLLKNLSYNDAYQELITIIREGKDGEFMKLFKKANLNNGYLSAMSTKIDDDGNIIYGQGAPSNNQRDAAAIGMLLQINQIKAVLNAEGALLSKDALIDRNLLGDLRYQALRKSSTAARFNQELNTLAALIVEQTNTILQLLGTQGAIDSHKDEAKADAKSDEAKLKAIKEAKDKLLLLIDKKNNLVNGGRALDFYKNALFEMSYAINEAFFTPSFLAYAEFKEGMDFYKISKEKLATLNQEYQNYCKTSRRDDVKIALGIWELMYNAGVPSLMEHVNTYYETQPLVQHTDDDGLTSYRIDSLKYNEGVLLREMATLEGTNLGQRVNSQEEAANFLNHVYSGEIGLSPIQGGNDLTLNLGLIEFTLKRFDPNLYAEFKEALLAEDNAGNLSGEYEEVNDTYINILDSYLPKAYLILANNLFSGLMDLNGNQTNADGSGLLDAILKRGWIDPRTKVALLQFIENKVKFALNDRFNDLLNEGYSSNEITEALRNTYHIIGYSETTPKGTTEYKSALDLLSHSPIYDWLSKFAVSINQEKGKSVVELLQNLDELVLSNLNDTGKIVLGTEMAQAVDSALLTVRMAKSLLESVKNNTADITNRFGFTTTLNEVMKKTKTKLFDEDGNEIKFEEYVSIDDEHITPMLFDLDKVQSKLKFLKLVSAVNNGAKLTALDRIDLNTQFNLFKALKRIIVSIKDEDEGAQEFKNALNELELPDTIFGNIQKALLDNVKSKEEIFTITAENQLILALKDKIKMDRAVRRFFSKHINDEAYMSKLIEDSLVKEMFTRDEEISTVDTNDISANVALNYIASRIAVDSNAFLNKFQKILGRTLIVNGKTVKVAPIGPLRELILLGYSYVMNRKPFDLMLQYARKALESFTNKNKDLALNLRRQSGIIFSHDAPLDSEISPNWLITFVEGIPGAGKTTAVYSGIAALLLQDNPDILKNSWVGHIDEAKAEKLKKSIGLEGKAVHMNKNKLMNTIVVNYVDPIDAETGKLKENLNIDDITIEGPDHIRRPKWDIATINPTQVPKVIFIDEISRYSAFDLWALDTFARKYGTAIITAGDYDQTKLTGSATKKEGNATSTYTFEAYRGNTIHALKLGYSMRPNNSLKDSNIKTMLALMPDLTSNNAERRKKAVEHLKFHYYESPDGHLFGELVKWVDKTKLKDDVVEIIDRMYANLKDGLKVGFIKSPNKSAYLTYVELKYKDLTTFYEETNAQGDELQYYIVEPNEQRALEVLKVVDGSDSVVPAVYWRNVYTGITRSEEASLIIRDAIDPVFEVDSTKDESTVPMDLDLNAIELSIEKLDRIIKGAIDNIIEPEDEIKYIPFVDIDELPSAKPDDKAEKSVQYDPSLLPAIIYPGIDVTIPQVYQGTEMLAATPPNIPVEDTADAMLESSGKVLKTEELAKVDALNKPKDTDPVPIVDDDDATLFFYTNTANHNGWPKRDGKYILPTAEQSHNRIDGFNGLLRIIREVDPKFQVTPEVITQWQSIMDMLRGYTRDSKSKMDVLDNGNIIELGLTTKIANILKSIHPDINVDDLNITFGVKTSAHVINDKGWNRYYVDEENEELDYMHAAKIYVKDEQTGANRLETDEEYKKRLKEDTRILQIPRKELVMVISNKKESDSSATDILEVSLAGLPNPISLIRAQGFEKLDSIWKTYNKSESFDMRVAKLRKLMDNLKQDDVPFLQGLKTLTDLFLWGNGKVREWQLGRKLTPQERARFNQFFPIIDPDWTFGLFSFTGPDLVNLSKGSTNLRNPYETGDFNYDGEWLTLLLFANEHGLVDSDGNRVEINGEMIEGSRYVSPVMFARYGTFEISGRPVNYANPGHPFVLISDSPGYNTLLAVQDQFFKQLKEAGGDVTKMYESNPKVRLVYVNAPLATVKEYFENLHNILTGQGSTFHIGNDFTAFRIYEIVSTDMPTEFEKLVGNDLVKMPEFKAALEKLKTLLDLKNKITGELQIAKKDLNLAKVLKLESDYKNIVELQIDLLTSKTNAVKTVYAKDPVTVKLALNSLLSDLTLTEDEGVDGQPNIDENKLAVITQALINHRIQGIYYNVRAARSDANNSDMLEVATTGNNYEINGRQFTINGKLNTPTGKGRANPVLKAFSSISSDDKAMLDISHAYISGKLNDYVWSRNKKEAPKTPFLQFLETTKLSGPSNVTNKIENYFNSNPKATYDEVVQYLQSEGHIVIETSTSNFVTDEVPELKGHKFTVLVTTDPVNLLREVIFVTSLYSNDEVREYSGTIDYTKKSIDLSRKIIKSGANVDGVIKTKPVFDDSALKTEFDNLMKNVFNGEIKISSYLAKYGIDLSLFTLDSIEDFINLLNTNVDKPAIKRAILKTINNKLQLLAGSVTEYADNLLLLWQYIDQGTNPSTTNQEEQVDCATINVKF